MRSSRFATILVLMCSCYAVGSGCGSDDDPVAPPGKAGTGGRGGGDAAAGRGGSSGTAGRGGSAGSAGMGGGMMGTGGSAGTAGSAGTSGASGTTGSGGTAGAGDAAPDVSVDAAGGTAGASDASPDVTPDGSGGDSAPDAGVFKRCVEKCDSVDDCEIGDAGPAGLVCNSQGQCAAPNSFPTSCTSSTQCMVRARLTSLDCDASTPCANPNQVCADGGGGGGKCIARAPADGGTCTGFTNPDRTTVNVLGGDAATAEICLNDINRCGPEGECYTAVCQSDEECSLQLGGPICNTQTGRCDCMTDNDCGSIENTNKCINGRCGCSGVAACTVKTFNGTTAACE